MYVNVCVYVSETNDEFCSISSLAIGHLPPSTVLFIVSCIKKVQQKFSDMTMWNAKLDDMCLGTKIHSFKDTVRWDATQIHSPKGVLPTCRCTWMEMGEKSNMRKWEISDPNLSNRWHQCCQNVHSSQNMILLIQSWTYCLCPPQKLFESSDQILVLHMRPLHYHVKALSSATFSLYS